MPKDKLKYPKINKFKMAENKFYWDYSTLSDILSIHKNAVKTKESAELGDFTIDFDNSDNVVGIAIENASKFFEQMDVSKEDLENIKNASIRVDTRNPELALVWTFIKFPNKEEAIPVPTPIIRKRPLVI